MRRIAFYLFLIPLFAIAANSQSPAPSTWIHATNPQAAAAHSNAKSQEDERQIPPPVVGNVSNAPQSNAKAEGDGNKKDAASSNERWLVIATAALALFNLFMAIGAIWQAWTIKDEFISSHRPRIRIKHIWLQNEAELFNKQPIRVDLVMVNNGDTACTVTEIRFATAIVKKSYFLPIRLLDKGKKALTNIPFGAGITHVHEGLSDGRTLTLAEATKVRQGVLVLYCIGDVEYLDGARIPRKTAFCRAYMFPRLPNRYDHTLASDGRFRPEEKPDTDYEYQD